jgi:hypothetical protein
MKDRIVVRQGLLEMRKGGKLTRVTARERGLGDI